jgi:hypothetical protein
VILYAAGGCVDGVDEHLAEVGLRNRLLSFFPIQGAEHRSLFWLDERCPKDARVFLDSGAFGARTQGVSIDFERYCDFVAAKASAVTVYANLDDGTWRHNDKHLAAMRGRGLSPMPVYHLRDPWRCLERMAADNDYIGVSGAGTSQRREQIEPQLDIVFERLYRVRWPVKVHMFGLLSQWALERYPFYSADSSGAIRGGAFGSVMRFEGGRIVTRAWIDDHRLTWDSMVADDDSPLMAPNGRAHTGRKVRNIQAQLQLEHHVTALWASRGVRWL